MAQTWRRWSRWLLGRYPRRKSRQDMLCLYCVSGRFSVWRKPQHLDWCDLVLSCPCQSLYPENDTTPGHLSSHIWKLDMWHLSQVALRFLSSLWVMLPLLFALHYCWRPSSFDAGQELCNWGFRHCFCQLFVKNHTISTRADLLSVSALSQPRRSGCLCAETAMAWNGGAPPPWSANNVSGTDTKIR